MTETTENVSPVETIAPVESAPIEAAPVVEAADVPITEAPVEVPVEKVAEPTTVLGEALKTEAKPEETKIEEPKETEGSQSDEPAPLPTYDAFTLPEGFTLREEVIGDINKLLGEFENNTKADHAEVQKLAQEFMNRHVAEVQSIQEKVNQGYLELFEKTKTDWRNDFVSDSEIGGNRQNTSVSSALEFIRTHGGTPEQQAEFQQLMEDTGVGNHKAMIRLLANAQRNLAEGKPIPATKPMPETKNKYEKFYGRT